MSEDHSRILCFPTINLDENDPWTMQALLYWDELYSIVPPDHQDGNMPLEHFTRSLVNEGLLRFEWLGGEIYEELPTFGEAFFGVVDALQPPNSGGHLHTWPKIHHGKVEHLAEELVRRQIAVKADGPWYRVEPQVANLYMTMLAIQMGNKSTLTPATGDPACNSILASMAAAETDYESARVASRLLRNILPVPGPSTSLRRIREFKEKHEHLLKQFRKDITDRSYLAAVIQDGDVSYHSLHLSQQLDELEAKMREGNFHSIRKIDWLDYGIVAGGAATAAAAAPIAPPLAWAGAGIAAAKLIQATLKIKRAGDLKRHVERQPVAYAALAHHEFPASRRP